MSSTKRCTPASVTPTGKLAQQRVKACPYCGGVGKHATEDVFQADVERLAKLHGWLFLHINDSRVPVRRGGRLVWVGDSDTAGFPDLLLLHPRTGRLLVWELKACRGTATARQKEWLNAFVAAGVEAGVRRPKDKREIEHALAPTRR